MSALSSLAAQTSTLDGFAPLAISAPFTEDVIIAVDYQVRQTAQIERPSLIERRRKRLNRRSVR